MLSIVLTPRTQELFPLDFIKSHLRISHDGQDDLLRYLLGVATDWVENELGKSLLKETRQVTHNNNRFCLPYGPIIKILAVQYHKKTLSQGEYGENPMGDTLEISVPFRWKCPQVVVQYEAGYGENARDVPSALRHAVLGTLEYLYENKGETETLEHHTAPWLRAHRSYRLI